MHFRGISLAPEIKAVAEQRFLGLLSDSAEIAYRVDYYPFAYNAAVYLSVPRGTGRPSFLQAIFRVL